MDQLSDNPYDETVAALIDGGFIDGVCQRTTPGGAPHEGHRPRVGNAHDPPEELQDMPIVDHPLWSGLSFLDAARLGAASAGTMLIRGPE